MLKIKEVAKSKNLSITALADKIGMSQVSLSRIINGNPTVETLSKIAGALEVDIRDLFEGNPDNAETVYVKRGESFVEVGRILKKIP